MSGGFGIRGSSSYFGAGSAIASIGVGRNITGVVFGGGLRVLVGRRLSTYGPLVIMSEAGVSEPEASTQVVVEDVVEAPCRVGIAIVGCVLGGKRFEYNV